MTTIDKYVMKFEKKPKLLWGTDFDDEIYIEIMEKAIKRNSPLTNDEVDKAFENVSLDIAR